MNYPLEVLQTELKNEKRFFQMHRYVNHAHNEETKKAYLRSREIALERIPQLEEAIKILKSKA